MPFCVVQNLRPEGAFRQVVKTFKNLGKSFRICSLEEGGDLEDRPEIFRNIPAGRHCFLDEERLVKHYLDLKWVDLSSSSAIFSIVIRPPGEARCIFLYSGDDPPGYSTALDSSLATRVRFESTGRDMAAVSPCPWI